MKKSLSLSSGHELIADVCDDCANIGDELFARLAEPAGRLKSGETATTELDWATVLLRAEEQSIFVDEPDYAYDSSRFVESLRVTSQVFLLQRQLLQMVGAMAQPVAAQNYVRVSDDALRAISVIAHRFAEADPILTGWQVISPASDQNNAFGLYTVRELTVNHLVWCVPFVLPAKWSFRFAGTTLLSCESPNGEKNDVMLPIDL